MIDWARLAEPQLDGSDTAVIWDQARTGRYPTTPACDGEKIWPDGVVRFGVVAERPDADFHVQAPDHPTVRAGLQLLDLWPAARRQVADLLVAIAPMTQHRVGGHGCACGNYRDDFGWIYVTADDVWGFAEGIVHEMGHWKLRALGIWFEEWTDALLTNHPDELYTSPVRKDKARPMGAVLHAQYSYIHVARMTTLALQAVEHPERNDVEWASLQLKRIAEGQGTIREHARGTSVGMIFLTGVDEWTSRVLTEGNRIVDLAKERAG